MGNKLRNSLQVLIVTVSSTAVGVLIGPLLVAAFNSVFCPSGPGNLGSGLALVLFSALGGGFVGGLLGFVAGLWIIGFFDPKEHRYQPEEPEVCLSCDSPIPATESVCPNCGWSWQTDTEPESH